MKHSAPQPTAGAVEPASNTFQGRPRGEPTGIPATDRPPSDGRPAVAVASVAKGRRSAAAARVVLAAAGLAMLAIGAAVALDGAATPTVITPTVAGALLLVSPFILARLEPVPVAATAPDLLTSTLTRLGAYRTAQLLDGTDLTRLADAYGFIHHVLRAAQYATAQTHLQDAVMARASEIAMTAAFDHTEVHAMFHNGPPVVRDIALGLMEGDESLTDVATITAATTRPRSANEQRHGLRLAIRVWHTLQPQEQQTILTHLQNDPDVRADTDRTRLAQDLKQRTQP